MAYHGHMADLVFEAVPEEDSGCGAECLTGYIFTEGDTWGQIMVGRQCGLEETLDILDTYPGEEFPLREEVAKAVATAFGRRRPLLDYHRRFLRNLSRRADSQRVPILSLTYDPRIELAAVEEGVLVCDGFGGGSGGYFDAAALGYIIGTPATRRGRAVTQGVPG